MRAVAWPLMLGLLAASAPTGAADSLESALRDSQWFGYAKAMLVADDKEGGRPNQRTTGFGGKLGGETGSYHGFQLKAAAYTTQDLGLNNHDPRKIDTYMFDLDKMTYSLLGESQLKYSAGRTALTLGRQEIHSPLMASYDYRIIPNLYEAYTLVNRDLPDSTVTLSYVSKMAGLDGLLDFSKFRSMSQQAYTSLKVAADGTVDAVNGDTLEVSRVVGHRGVWMAGLVYEQTHKFQLWNYYGVDTLNTVYLDGRLRQKLSEDWSTLLEAQTYRVAAVGQFKDYLAQRGLNASYDLFGLKATLAHRPSGLSVALAGNHFTGDRNTVTAFSNWGGYPEFVIMPYIHAGNNGATGIARSTLAKLTVLLDLGAWGLKDHNLLFGHAHIDLDERILAGADIRVNSLLYRARLTPGLSARLALESRNSGHSRYNNEFVALALRYDF